MKYNEHKPQRCGDDVWQSWSVFYLQYWNAGTAKWARRDENHFDSALNALEARDEIRASYENDGIPRGVRVVDEDGNVIEYGVRHV